MAGRRVGKALLMELIENNASIALHRRGGFHILEAVGRKHGAGSIRS